jgi:methyltransferase-like protein 6
MNTIATQDEGIIDAAASGPLAGLDADCVLMIFTLSALWPKDMLCMLRHAYHALRPDGLLLFRDYGLYDMAQLRFSGSQLLDPGEFLLYQRLDGTLSSFFSIERMEKLAHDAGFQVVECEYVTTFVKNRRKKTQMKRIFVHGVFKKREKLI